jgi:hypothetical protein
MFASTASLNQTAGWLLVDQCAQFCAPFNRFIEAVSRLFFARDGPVVHANRNADFQFSFFKVLNYETRNQTV